MLYQWTHGKVDILWLLLISVSVIVLSREALFPLWTLSLSQKNTCHHSFNKVNLYYIQWNCEASDYCHHKQLSGDSVMIFK